MKIRHLVHSCLLVEVAGRRLLVDPGSFSTRAVRELGAEPLVGLAAVLIPPQHADHVDPGLITSASGAARRPSASRAALSTARGSGECQMTSSGTSASR